MSLLDDIKDIIYEEIPISTTCPNCEQDIDEGVLMPIDEDEKGWDTLVMNVVRRVLEASADLFNGASDDDIRNL